MFDEKLINLLKKVSKGDTSAEEAYEKLKNLPFEDLCHTKLDHHRLVRRGLEEVVFGQGKTIPQIKEIITAMKDMDRDVLVTRLSKKAGKSLKESFPAGTYEEEASCFIIKNGHDIKGKGIVLVVSAGTSDIKVAEEAYITSIFFGNQTEKLYDVGVAGIHRLLQNLETLRKARVIIVAAGMEGALPSIIAGIVSVPVIGIPTSIGYGASFGGLTALLAMLNSCSTVSVFNIDNGFGAAYFATLINRL